MVRHSFAFLSVALMLGHACASDDQRFVQMDCDQKADLLSVRYSAGGFPSGGEVWDTFDLKENFKEKDAVKSLHPVSRTCHLRSGNYKVVIRPVPGNYNLNGKCGGLTFGGVTITLGSREISKIDFETCMAEEIVASVLVKSGKVSVNRVASKDFYGL